MAARQPRFRALIAFMALAIARASSAGEPLRIDPVTYDRAYPAIGYADAAEDNAVARLVARLVQGDVALAYGPSRGYLDSLLVALDIDASSQVLVFSRTSLQAPFVSSATPRAIYFNDDTYVAFVQGSEQLEIVAIDDRRGPVFFTVRNAAGKPLAVEREGLRCMACHDSAALRPGGIPKVLLLSSPVDGEVNPPLRAGPAEVTHAMPLEDRWGGWFVTGSLGPQLHVGNLPLAGAPDPTVRNIHNRNNLGGLQGHIDTTPYLTDKSDVVALLALEHQAYVQNLITRVRYEASGNRAAAQAQRWRDVAEADRAALAPALDKLAAAMTFEDERKLLGRIRGNAGFEADFVARGPTDPQGRSLREFDLRRRTYRYPISYLIYSAQFDALPAAAKDYLYGELLRTVRTPSGDEPLDADRKAALEILRATKPDFAAWLESAG